MRLLSRLADWLLTNRGGALCYDCGAKIIASDDDALICIQCGGRNRRDYPAGHNGPPPKGAKPPPPPAPPHAARDALRQGRNL